jgi:isopenicillin-N epimerase
MSLDRRGFLAAGGALAAAALTPGTLLAALERQAARTRAAGPAPDLSSWANVRAQFSLAPGYAHMASFFFVSHPKPVREAIEQYRRALDEEPFLFLEQKVLVADGLYGPLFGEIAKYVGSRPDEIALMPNTTTGLAMVYHGIPLKAGDEVLTTTHDHYSHAESIRYSTARCGASVRKIALYDRGAEANRDEIVRRVRQAIRPNTRVFGVTWVHSSTGVRLPIAAIADVVRDANRGRPEAHRLLLVVDGVHGFGCTDFDVAKLGCDFFCAGTHKWIFAPRGTGIVWGPAERWAMMRPVVPDFMSPQHFEGWMQGKPAPPIDAAQMSPGGFQAYEHQWGMKAAFEMHRAMGRARVAQRVRELNDRIKTGLAGMRGVTLHTPRDPELSAGINCFEIRGVAPDQVVAKLLEKKIVASTSPYGVSYARLCGALVNDTADIDRALDGVRSLAPA